MKQMKNKKKIFIILLIIVLVLGGILFSPLFSIKTINVEGCEHFTEGEILEMAGLSENQNIFAFNARKARKNLKENTYIEDVTFDMNYPSEVNVTVKERKVRGYVPYMGSYLYIDEYGRVLDIREDMTEALPVVYGLDFSGFTLGELLETNNEEAFDIIVKIAQLMTKYNLLDMVVNIDVSDTKNIKATVNKVEVTLGEITDIDQKIRTMTEIIKNIPEKDRGTLDLSDLSKPWVFKYLT